MLSKIGGDAFRNDALLCSDTLPEANLCSSFSSNWRAKLLASTSPSSLDSKTEIRSSSLSLLSSQFAHHVASKRGMGAILILMVDKDGAAMEEQNMENKAFEVRSRADQAKNVPRVLSVIYFEKYLSTDIFYNICFQSRNICKQILFQNGYFSLLYVDLKTVKLATENRYSKKKMVRVTLPGYDTDSPSKTQKNICYPFSVEQRHRTQDTT